jgi:hypothetical protein
MLNTPTLGKGTFVHWLATTTDPFSDARATTCTEVIRNVDGTPLEVRGAASNAYAMPGSRYLGSLSPETICGWAMRAAVAVM